MGQESSQVAGDNQSSNEGITTPISGRKEGEHSREEDDREYDSMEQYSPIIGAAKAIGLPKSRKKKKVSAFSQATQEAAETTIVHRGRGGTSTPIARSQKLQSPLDEVDASTMPPIKRSNRKKAKLKAKKKQQLPGATTTAVIDAKSQDSDGEAAEGVLDDPGDLKDDSNPEFNHNPGPNRIEPLKKSQKLDGVLSVTGISKVNKSKSKSSIPILPNAIDNGYDNFSPSRNSKTPRSAKASEQKMDNIKAISKKRKINGTEGDSVVRPGKRQNRSSEIPNGNPAEAQLDDVNSPRVDAELKDNSLPAGYNRSPLMTSGAKPVSTPKQNGKSVLSGGASDNLNTDTPELSPQHSRNVKADQQTSTGVKKSRILPPRRAAPVNAMMTPGKTESFAEDMALVDSTPSGDQNPASDSHIVQLDIQNRIATPQTSGKHRRRLSVDVDNLDKNASEKSGKKFRKRALKPKGTPKSSEVVNTPETSTLKARSNKKSRHGTSPDLGESVTKSGNSKRRKDPTKVLGRFSAEEIAILDKELLKHREMFKTSEHDQNQLIHADASRSAEFWNEICEALPDRPRQAVIKACRRKYHNYGIRGNWTKEDDRQLRKACDRFPRQWKEIGQMMDRHPDDVRDRWRNYVVCGDSQKKDYWTQEEEDNLRSVVRECVQAVRELRSVQAVKGQSSQFDSRPDIELVDWFTVSEKLGKTRSRLQCSVKWKQLMKLERSDNDEIPDLELEHKSWRIRVSNIAVRNMDRNDYLDLLLAIQNSQAGKEGTVPWHKIGDMNFKAKWSCMDRKVAWKKLRATIPGNEDMKIQDIVAQLLYELPTKELVDAQSSKESSEVSSSPSLQATVQLSHRNRSSKKGSRLRQEEPNEQIDRIIDNDLYLDQRDEDEFDPDDIEGRRADSFETFQNSRDVIRDVIAEEYDYENSDEEINEETNGITSDNYDDDSDESIGLDSSSPQVPSSGGAAQTRPRQPFDSNDALDEDTSSEVDSSSDSDSDVLVTDTPVRRPTSIRYASVDLDEPS